MDSNKYGPVKFGKSAIPIIVIIGSLLIAGCINPPVKNSEPEGAAISALGAVIMANESLSKKFEGFELYGPITFQNLSSMTCKWKGTSAGNATQWHMNFKAILISNSSYYYIEGWAWVRNPEGRWQVLTGPGDMGAQWIYDNISLNISASGKLVPDSQLNMALNESLASDFKKYIKKNDSFQVYNEAKKYQRKTHPINRVSLYAHNSTTMRRASWDKIPVWEIEWKYQWGEKLEYYGDVQKLDKETVVLNALDLTMEEQR